MQTCSYLEPRLSSEMALSTLTMIRWAFAILCIFTWCWTIKRFGFWSQTLYLSGWGLVLSWITTLSTIYLTSSDDQHEALKNMTYQLLQFTLSINVVITIVYWTTVHPEIMKNDPKMQETGEYIMQWLIHTTPMICLAVNVALSRISFHYSDALTTLLLTSFYMCINFGYVKVSGNVIYHFLPWNNAESYKTAVFLLGLCYFSALFCVAGINQLPIPNECYMIK